MVDELIPTRTAMEGKGFYNKNSTVQGVVATKALALLRKTAAELQVGNGAIVIADYGSSQGRNSMAPMRTAIELLRERLGSERTVLVFHTDLPSNDFTSLFNALLEDPASYMANSRGIFPAAVGRSFFEAVLPPEQVHLGWSMAAAHWLSQKTVNAPDHVLPRLSADPAVRAAAIGQSNGDWTRFLSARARELRQGGKLIVGMTATADKAGTSDLLWSQLWEVLVQAGRAGLISDQQLLRITMATHSRSLAEVTAPFADGGRFDGLHLEHAELTQVPDPFWDAFEQSGDAAQFGTSWSNWVRAIASPTITAAIGPDRADILDNVFERLSGSIAAAPVQYNYDHILLVAAKTG